MVFLFITILNLGF